MPTERSRVRSWAGEWQSLTSCWRNAAKLTGDAGEYHRALPLGILSLALGAERAGETQFNIVKRGMVTAHVGYLITSEAGVPHPDASLSRIIARRFKRC
jgi:hypothetical protein